MLHACWYMLVHGSTQRCGMLAACTHHISGPCDDSSCPLLLHWPAASALRPRNMLPQASCFLPPCRELFGDAVLGATNLAMIETARSVGAAAKFTGSGGAIITYCPGGQQQVAALKGGPSATAALLLATPRHVWQAACRRPLYVAHVLLPVHQRQVHCASKWHSLRLCCNACRMPQRAMVHKPCSAMQRSWSSSTCPR